MKWLLQKLSNVFCLSQVKSLRQDLLVLRIIKIFTATPFDMENKEKKQNDHGPVEEIIEQQYEGGSNQDDTAAEIASGRDITGKEEAETIDIDAEKEQASNDTGDD